MHHLDSWIKTDQLDVTCFIISLFTARHVSNVSTSIFRSLRLTVDLVHVFYCSGSMCVGVTVWFGWGGVVSLCRLKHSTMRSHPSWQHPTTATNHIQQNQNNTPNAVTGSLFSWRWAYWCPKHVEIEVNNKHLIIASCWFFSLHNLLTMHGHRNLKLWKAISEIWQYWTVLPK